MFGPRFSNSIQSSRWRALTESRACPASLLLALGLGVTGCHAKPPADRTASLPGTWVGAMLPSRDGSVLDNVSTNGPDVIWMLLEIAPPDVAGGAVSGKASFCENQKAVGTMSFQKARFASGSVPLTDGSSLPAQSLAFYDMNQGATSMRAVLTGQGQVEAGYLQKNGKSVFEQKCHPS